MAMLATMRTLSRGGSLVRIRMDEAFARHTLRGKVVDVGGGRSPSYLRYFKRDSATIEPVDGSISGIDFEKDPLPYKDGSVDTVICANVLEHIYNYRFVVGEIRRILKPGGTLVGFVPFLIQYHPDPHDYFRYTKESLVRIFTEAGFMQVEIRTVGGGPFSANFSNLVLSVPRPLRGLLYVPYAFLDALFLRLRPAARERYPLGYTFYVS
ncbi:MAG: class I SAM-dependent methyltransferase [Patescibacteria group bacterium]|nr:class I SAM-dependent methyltransferase [Patescibacteria group bacterium]